MKYLIAVLTALIGANAFAGDPCAKVAFQAAKNLEQINSRLNGCTATLKAPRPTRQTLESKGASQSYRVDVSRSDGAEYYYLVQTRGPGRENCFLETVAYWYSE